jgi:cupin 2 domain-containing protein
MNLFSDLPEALPEELAQQLAEQHGVRIERIVSTGHATPAGSWYDQEGHEWVVVLRGSAGLLFEGEAEPHRLGPGDHVFIPAHRRHRVVWTDRDEPTLWLAVHWPVAR